MPELNLVDDDELEDLIEGEVEDVEKTPEEQEREAKAVAKWLKRIKDEKDVHEDYRDQAGDAWGIYLNDLRGHNVFYPLLWSIVNIEHSAVYSGTPIPDIRPRNTDKNPIFKESAQVMQRALEFYLDNTDFDENMDRTVDDYLVAALGVPRVKLDAEILDDDPENPQIGEQVIRIEHVPWNRFGWEPVSNWDHCDWIYFEHHMKIAEIKKRWGDDLDITPQDNDPSNNKDSRSRTKNEKNRGVVYEIWDKKNEEVLIIAKGCTEILEANKDPLNLSGFYPVPKPLMLNLSYDELIPSTDYSFIEQFDRELQRLYKRRRAIIEQIKAASLHDASLIEIEDFSTIEDGDSVPVQHMQDRMEGGADLRKVIMFWPNAERIEVVKELTNQINLIRAHVDDIMGISDILRGSSDPQDGVGTQNIKERWAGIRLRRKQKAVQAQVRDIFRMMAELTVEHITPENLEAMTQMKISPQVHALLRNDLMREFAIDVETDSTIAKDEMMDRAMRNELLKSLVGYVQTVAPAVMQNAIPADLAREMLQVATDPYKKYSRGMDDVIEAMPTTMKQLQGNQQKIGEMEQRNQKQLQELQAKDYALAQYSKEQNARDDMEIQGKHAQAMATATKNLAGASLEEVKAMLIELQAVTEQMKPSNVEADTALKQADANATAQTVPMGAFPRG